MGMFGVTPARSCVCRVLVRLCVPLILFSVVLVLCAAGCDATPAVPTGDDADPGQGTDNHTLDDTTLQGRVLYKDMDIFDGQDLWDEFVSKSTSGEPCTVGLAFYLSPPDESRYSPEAYNEALKDYQAYRLAEIHFDGATYHYTYTEGRNEYRRAYKYLIRYSGKPANRTAPFSEYVYYVLLNDNTLTWEQIEARMVSAQSDVGIDHRVVYSDRIYD